MAYGAYQEAVRVDPSNPIRASGTGHRCTSRTIGTQLAIPYLEQIRRLGPDQATGYGSARSLLPSGLVGNADPVLREGGRSRQAGNWSSRKPGSSTRICPNRSFSQAAKIRPTAREIQPTSEHIAIRRLQADRLPSLPGVRCRSRQKAFACPPRRVHWLGYENPHAAYGIWAGQERVRPDDRELRRRAPGPSGDLPHGPADRPRPGHRDGRDDVRAAPGGDSPPGEGPGRADAPVAEAPSAGGVRGQLHHRPGGQQGPAEPLAGGVRR